LPSSCCCWRSATSWGLALFSHRSASRIFITQPDCSPPSTVTQDDDRRLRGGEERAGPWPLPCPQLQGCSSSVLGGRAGRVAVGSSAWAGDPLLPPALGGEGRSPALWRMGTATCCLVGVWLSVHRTGDGRAVRGSTTSTASPAPLVVLGGRTRRCTPRGWRRRSWMVLSSLRGSTGVRTSSRALRQPPSTGAEVAAVVGAEVVAAAGEAAPCRGGCLRCRDHQSHLLLSPRLFGFNGLAVTPRRRTGARTYSQ